MKVLILSKKHKRMIEEEFKTSTSSPYEQWNGMLNGIDFIMYVRPYLKKIRVIETPKMELKLPTEPTL